MSDMQTANERAESFGFCCISHGVAYRWKSLPYDELQGVKSSSCQCVNTERYDVMKVCQRGKGE